MGVFAIDNGMEEPKTNLKGYILLYCITFNIFNYNILAFRWAITKSMDQHTHGVPRNLQVRVGPRGYWEMAVL